MGEGHEDSGAQLQATQVLPGWPDVEWGASAKVDNPWH